MRFRPCIDIHNGQVKQIVGSSLADLGNSAQENFVSEQDAEWYALLYQKHHLPGGHIILLNPEGSKYYEADRAQADKALAAFPGGLQIGGGIHADNAAAFIDAGASHVIATSYVFVDGRIHFERLQKLSEAVGKAHLVLDLSCKRKSLTDGAYYVVTDRWQKYTDEVISRELFEKLEPYCDEFLVHAVDVEGKATGIEEELISRLARCTTMKLTYAGGIRQMADIQKINQLGAGNIDFTIGSALDLFGGQLSFEALCRQYSFA